MKVIRATGNYNIVRDKAPFAESNERSDYL